MEILAKSRYCHFSKKNIESGKNDYCHLQFKTNSANFDRTPPFFYKLKIISRKISGNTFFLSSLLSFASNVSTSLQQTQNFNEVPGHPLYGRYKHGGTKFRRTESTIWMSLCFLQHVVKRDEVSIQRRPIASQ